MGDLQQINLRQAPPNEIRVDAFLDVSGKQEPMPACLAEEHDRDVVDRRAAVRGPFRNAGRIGPQHAETDAVESQLVTRPQAATRSSATRQHGGPRSVARAGAEHARLVDPPDVVAREKRGEPGDVILVRVGQDKHVDAPIPGRQTLVERNQESIWIGPAIDDEAATAPALDEDAVTLADVEDDDTDNAVRAMGHGEGDRDRRSGEHGRGEASLTRGAVPRLT